MNNSRFFFPGIAFLAAFLFVSCGLNPQDIGYVKVQAVHAYPDTVAACGDTIKVTAEIDYFLAQNGEHFSRYWNVTPADVDTFSRGDTLFIIAPAYQVHITATIQATISALTITSGSIGISVLNLAAPALLWSGIADGRTLLQTDSLLVFSLDARYQHQADSMGFEIVNGRNTVIEDTVVPGRPLTHSLDLTAMLGVYSIRARAWARDAAGVTVMGADTVTFVVNADDILPKKRMP